MSFGRPCRTQTNYYKGAMSGNLTKILNELIASKRVNSLANDQHVAVCRRDHQFESQTCSVLTI